MDEDFALEPAIAQWRSAVSAQRAIAPADADELESHLRDRVDELESAGLAPDEAFLIAIKRLGAIDRLTDEYAREHSDRLWKQLTPAASAPAQPLWTAVVFAIVAAAAVKIPSLFDATGDPQMFGGSALAFANGVLLVLAVLAAYFAVVRRAPALAIGATAAGFIAVGAALDLYPLAPDGMTYLLAVLHAPVALWLLTAIVFVAGDWRSIPRRMDFIRYTGEWVVYFVLIALGGGVLVALTIGLFSAIDVDVVPFVQDVVLPCGAAGATIFSAWLVETKQSVIENIAPVLTKAFTPLFTALLLALIVVGLVQGGLDTVDRNLLILFDLTLLVVLGLLLYSLSARDPLARPGWFDRLQVLLLASAIAVDLIVLVAMLTRIGAFGVSANKAASLGLNLLLLVNLVVALWLQVRFVLRRTPFATLERWQTGYVPVYLAWCLIVIVVFPPVFAFS
ncbi:MAG: permease prefix domain 1-containing protein [Microbacterium sp.]